MFKFAIIGAGVVGAMVCRELEKYEKEIVILEKESDVSMGQSKANSGIVHAGYDPVPGTLKAKLNVEGNLLMEETCKKLDVKYKNNGALIVGYNDSDVVELEKLYERGKLNGVPNLKLISGDEARKMEKNLTSKIIKALYVPTSGIVCPYELTIHATGCAMNNGATLKRNFEVAKITDKGEYFEIISKSGEKVAAETVINAAGLYSDEIAKMVSDDSFKITPRSGEYYLMDKEAGDLVTMTIFKTPSVMGKGVLAVKTVDGNILLGPTSKDRESKDDTKITREGLDFVKARELDFFDSLPWNNVITQFTGLRAHGDKHDFIINMPIKRFVNLAGIESPGLTSAPAIAKYVVKLLKENGYVFNERDDYDDTYTRGPIFMQLSIKEKKALIEKRPEFGHMVCRCEEVTEGEIIDAIRLNPGATDVDGIKRRTRAGMGRCQGGFCMPVVLDILERELGQAYTEISKKGNGSEYTFQRTKNGGALVTPKGGK